MKKRQNKFLLIGIAVTLLLLSVFAAMKFGVFSSGDDVPTSSNLSNFASGGENDDSGRVYNRDGSSGGYTPLMLDVKNCEIGRDGVYFGFGHTEFLVIKKQDASCHFEYGTEIENPNWNGKLDVRCKIPTSQAVTLTVEDHGINFGPIQQFCSEK